MRVDASQVLAQGGVKIKAGTGTAMDSLKEGDVVRAGVVASDKSGILTLKLEGGQSFSAKLGTDIKLSPGDVILLEVSAKEKGLISLSFSGVETADDDLSLGQKSLVRDFTDKSLAPYASKLAELNMPVTEESARVMRDLVAQNPGLSLDEAAFLASNKLTGDESLMKAALATLAGGDKTADMIAELMSQIKEQNALTDLNLGVRNPDLGVDGSKLPNAISSGENNPAFTVNTANAAPLTELLTTIIKNFSGTFATPVQVEAQPASVTQTIIAQSDTIMQSNAGNVEELLTHSGEKVESTTLQQNTAGSLQGDVPSAATAGTAASAGSAAAGDIVAPGSNTAVNPDNTAAQTSTNTATPAQSMGSVVAGLLSDIPEFSGTPQSALQRFSEMLLRVAGDSQESGNSTETLTAQLDKLFTRIGRDDSDAGARLRDARQELYARLALIEETISRAAQPARAEMLVQTQKLMDHVRLLNSIEQFVYMQMPVQMSDERKTADLYVFKRKGGKRTDPDNVNILMAIDLEFMGHWEALINIKNKEVSIQMEVPSDAEKDHFNSNTVMLHELLSEAGFKLVSTNIKISQEETTVLTALSAFDRYSGGKQGIIDFMI